MLRVRADTVDALAEIEAVQALVVRFVVVEADEWQRSDIRLLQFAVRLLDGKGQLQAARRRGLIAVDVAVVLAGDVAREGVASVGPPEAGALILVERQDLLGQRLCLER